MTTINTIKARNEEIGHHFFSSSTLDFFKSRVYDTTFGDFFVTSEKGPDNVRAYTVRYQYNDGTIGTVGEFQQWSTLKSALRAAERANQELIASTTKGKV